MFGCVFVCLYLYAWLCLFIILCLCPFVCFCLSGCVFVCVSLCLGLCVCICVSVSVSLFVFLCLCFCVSLSFCLSLSMVVFVCLCLFVSVCVSLNECLSLHVCVSVHLYVWAGINPYLHILGFCFVKFAFPFTKPDIALVCSELKASCVFCSRLQLIKAVPLPFSAIIFYSGLFHPRWETLNNSCNKHWHCALSSLISAGAGSEQNSISK